MLFSEVLSRPSLLGAAPGSEQARFQDNDDYYEDNPDRSYAFQLAGMLTVEMRQLSQMAQSRVAIAILMGMGSREL